MYRGIRDVKFEVQYLLSLTLVVFGILSTNELQGPANEWVGYLVVFLLAIHVSIFNLLYGFAQALPFSISFFSTMRRLSWPVLLLVSFSFVYFIGHVVLSLCYHYFIQGGATTSDSWEIVIKYGAPFLPISMMFMGFREYVSGPISTFEAVNIKIVPDSLRVFSDKSETKPLLVKVDNDGEEVFEYTLDIEIPEQVTLHLDDDSFTGSFSDDSSLQGGHGDRYSFELSYEGEQRSIDILDVEVKFEGGSQSQNVELQLEP